VIQAPVFKGKTVTARFYKRNYLKKLNWYYKKCCPKTAIRGIYLLHDNASIHKASIVTSYLWKRSHGARTSTLRAISGPCDLILFPRVKKANSWPDIHK